MHCINRFVGFSIVTESTLAALKEEIAKDVSMNIPF